MEESPLTPVYIPALLTTLAQMERQKGSPLTEQEVLDIRDNGVCMMMQVALARALDEKRGYGDLDPEDVWAGWQKARAEIATPESVPLSPGEPAGSS